MYFSLESCSKCGGEPSIQHREEKQKITWWQTLPFSYTQDYRPEGFAHKCKTCGWRWFRAMDEMRRRV